MTTELRPLGVTCNIACQYCYQHPQRDVEPTLEPYDMEKMKTALLREGSDFIIFGGEALLVPLEDLEEIWAFGYRHFGRNGVQTNGTLITEEHIALFQKYNVRVGLSIDGPGALNDIRWAGTLEKTRAQTAATERAIDLLVEAGLPPAIIVTLHRGNATTAKLPLMAEWFRGLDAKGIRAVRLHLLEIESKLIRDIYMLEPQQNIEAMLFFDRLEREFRALKFDVFQEIAQLMRVDDDNVSCVWTGCDAYTTEAVRGVEGQGQHSNCGRTNKDGINFVKSKRNNCARPIALYHTPHEDGGCQGCRFFSMCKGQCPGTALDGDWRYRTEHCEVLFALFEQCEAKMLAEGQTPLSVHPARPLFEQILLENWRSGRAVSLQDIAKGLVKRQQALAS